MFQFAAFASRHFCRDTTYVVGFPIRTPAGQRLFAPNRRFSQLITSFIANVSQGIHRTPFLSFPYYSSLTVALNNGGRFVCFFLLWQYVIDLLSCGE